MTRRKTVDDWRYAIYRSTQLGDRTKVLLLYMADHMQPSRRVSIPRCQIARDLGRSERRITERIAEAHDKGWLDTVTRGQKGITAVYVGIFPDHTNLRGRTSVPQKTPANKFSGTPTSTLKNAETRPLNNPKSAFSGTDGGPANNEDNPFLDPTAEKRSKERGCFYCTDSTCCGECLEQQAEEHATTDERRWSA